ncbi:PUA-like domain-containing protein [Chiua virens]|nr:PUA-like domain-containing protein [Chiua virens]
MTTTIASNPPLLQGDVHWQRPPQVQEQLSPAAPDHSLSTSTPLLQDTPLPPPPEDNHVIIDARAEKKQRNERLRALSKTFGPIPGVPIFSGWDKRKPCSDSAVHRSIIAGICGNKKEGAFSIAVSGLYADDEDGGEIIIYTGAGGRERWTETVPRKRIRHGPQTQDQSWEMPSNRALMISSETGNPVRVIRSYRCPSKYAPLTGYRYDGLYKVTTCWTSVGKNGKAICRCRLERLPEQPPIPVRPPTLSTSTKRRQRLVSRQARCPPQPDNSHDLSGEMDVDVQSGIQSDPSSSMLESNDFAMIELDSQADAEQPKPLSPQRPASSNLNKNPDIRKLPRYRWDPKTNGLVRLPLQEDVGVEGEDDATLVPDEDGVNMSDAGDLSDMNHSPSTSSNL